MNAADRSTQGLLQTKFMPPRLHSTIIPRPELLARLDDSLNKRLTWITGPTGFGKTTLVNLWITHRGVPFAWVTLDANDNDPVRFWAYIITALRTIDPAIGKTTLAILTASQPASFRVILTPLINDLIHTTGLGVLVLEDYHTITNPEIQAGMAFLLQHLPGLLHLILISRSEPELPLGILRARDELLEINATQLCFSAAETEKFMRATLNRDIPTPALALLQERTEGWPAGLRLTALWLQGKGNLQDLTPAIQSFSGDHRFVASYLIQEVFDSQPADRQDFLLKTCFLNRLTGPVCDSITGTQGGAAVLGQLEKENLFLARLEHGGIEHWYRYSPLFAEALQSRARERLGEAGVREIFERASDWYERQQMFDDAIEAALAAGLYERAVALVENFVDIYSLNELYTLARWMEQIPTGLTLRHPEMCLTCAQVILYSSDRFAESTAARMEPYLNAAQQKWQTDGETGRVGEVLALRGMMLFWQGDYYKALEYVNQSLELLPEHEIYWRGISLLNAAAGEVRAGRMSAAQGSLLEGRALLGASRNIYGVLAATQMLADIYYWQGDHPLAVQIGEQILVEAVGDESMLDDQGTARLGLAHIAYEQNDLPTAERRAAEAVELARQRANEALEAEAQARMAFILAAQGRLGDGRELLKAVMSRLKNPAAIRLVQNAQARLTLMAGEADTLAGWEAMTADRQKLLFLEREQETFILTRLEIARGRGQKALELLQPIQADALEQGRVRSQVEALCLQAMAQHASGDPAQTADRLTLALRIGLEKGFRRLFLDEGPRMADLLQVIGPSLNKRSLHLYATALSHSFTSQVEAISGPPDSKTGLIEPLSQQEVRVLRLMAAGLSNPDIASELIVSTNTVKTHLKNIYRKLEVNSRAEAREVARELKLL
jgi:LuxR family maltose regulon positive regulatory protein